MELTTIEMSKEDAEARLAKYKAVLSIERTKQDEQIARGYRTLARGLPIIKLTESIMAGGYFENGLPHLAIARADSQDCWVDREGPWNSGEGRLIYSSERPPWTPRNRGALVNKVTVRVDVTNMPGWQRGHDRRAHTIMPLIPPDYRPRLQRLRQFHILWEVEEWKPVPPRDPALVRWIGGDLWEVVALWDLTELERAVLAR